MGMEDFLTIALLAVGFGVFWRWIALRYVQQRDGKLAQPLRDESAGMITLQLLASAGMAADPRRTFNEYRLRVSLGARLAVAVVTGLIAVTIVRMYGWQVLTDPQQPKPVLEGLILGFALLQTLYFATYELRYDATHLTAPRWFFGNRTRAWRDLSAITTEDAWFLSFRFDDGSTARVPKFVVGRAGLLEVAQHWLQHDERPPPAHARTSRG
ncbi:hypothetical protein [Rhodobacter ferrooxidans]|uniref:Uncharacterized protein n=1 Tax=Rhodobacter ferrooxidans TaxID=371731 RepID=C8RX82_9RHOB|nr:hypothetical protein [Rhodobacter sp. SW2]EEW26607.1 hypothetical protein Rsw2DRAFT_0410 [Rhodobacter sp. SW2]